VADNKMSYKLLRKMVESELSQILAGNEQRFSYLVEGPHGIGKSAFWKEICLEFNGYFVDCRLGQRDLGDIIGMPTIVIDPDGTKHMVHVKPELIRKMFVQSLDELGVMGDKNDPLSKDRADDRKGIKYDFILAFLDEYNRGTKDVQQAVFELVYDRRMNGDKVNAKTMIAAA
jgi:MoxR-like ATPase